MRPTISIKALLITAGIGSAMLSGPALASGVGGAFAVHGVGAVSCAKLNAVPAADAGQVRILLASWIMGYVSAVNRIQAGTYDATPVQDQGALVNMVAGVCERHPTSVVETVTDAVLQSLETAKISAASPEVVVAVGKRQILVRQATLMQVQQVLVKLKYLPAGDADGKFGAGTQTALVTYQTAEHLPATGLPDAATVVRALVETP